MKQKINDQLSCMSNMAQHTLKSMEQHQNINFNEYICMADQIEVIEFLESIKDDIRLCLELVNRSANQEE